MDLAAFEKRAKLADDQISALSSTLKSLVLNKCKTYRYEVVYYPIKNRGNFARLLFEEAGIPFDDNNDMNKVLTYFKCRNKLSSENSNKLEFDLFAPPAVIRYPLDSKSNEKVIGISQTAPIVGFLAQEFNLRPCSLENHYKSQMLIANANDILSEIFEHRNDSLDDLNKYYNGRMQIWLDILQKPLTIKPNQKYYFDDRCLAVDIAIYNICEGIIDIMGQRTKELFINTHPVLYKHYQLIKNRKSIKSFVDKQNKQKYEWWPSGYGIKECRDRLNGTEDVDDEKKEQYKPKGGGWKQAEKKEINDAANSVKQQVEKQNEAQNRKKFTTYKVISGTKQVRCTYMYRAYFWFIFFVL